MTERPARCVCYVSPALPPSQKAIGTTLPRTTSGWQAHESDFLLQAIESDDVVKVREKLEAAKVELDKELDGDPAEPAAGSVLDFVLTEPSLVAAHSFHTPLMAAVARGDLAIFTSLLHRFEQRFDTTSVRKLESFILHNEDPQTHFFRHGAVLSHRRAPCRTAVSYRNDGNALVDLVAFLFCLAAQGWLTSCRGIRVLHSTIRPEEIALWKQLLDDSNVNPIRC